MQNKGFVIVITALLALICAFYLSFSFVTRHYSAKADKMGAIEGQAYLDSMAGERVWMGYTLREAQRQQIGLGLDLKGGMSVVLKLNASDLLRNLANKSQDPTFLKALEEAEQSNDQKNFIDVFCDIYKKMAPDARLTALFAQGDLRDQITAATTDEEVRAMIKEKYQSAVDASYNVIRARIDGFGVASPNLQRLEGQGRILVELPGVKDPARVRDLLQRSANLQFWRTYSFEEVKEDLLAANDRVNIAKAPAMTASQSTTDSTAVTPEDAPASVTDSSAVGSDKMVAAEGYEVAPGAKLFEMLQPGGHGAVVGVAHRKDMARIDSILLQAQQMKLMRDDLKLLWGSKPIKGDQKKSPISTSCMPFTGI